MMKSRFIQPIGYCQAFIFFGERSTELFSSPLRLNIWTQSLGKLQQVKAGVDDPKDSVERNLQVVESYMYSGSSQGIIKKTA